MPKLADATQPVASIEAAPSDPANQLIVALDYPSAEAALQLVGELDGVCRWFKVGMELYYAAGPSIVERLVERDLKVFLDLKLHDIPNTVAGAVRSVGRTGASLLTIHASGGERMMRAAADAAISSGALELLAVTVLTSMAEADLAGVGIVADGEAVQSQVLRLARLARTAGIDGLVCSPEEVASVREVMGPGARLVTPGIRPDLGKGPPDDQRRTATPAQAIVRGASMLVVGRPITGAPDRRAAATAILAEIAGAR